MRFLATFLTLAVVACVAHAAVTEHVAQILRQTQTDPDPSGAYQFAFETENKISQHEIGSFKTAGPKGEEISAVKTGESAYETPDGHKIVLTYVADENGFQPKGEHIPPIPAYIIRSLEFIREQEARRPKKN